MPPSSGPVAKILPVRSDHCGDSSQRGHWVAVRGKWGRPWGFWEDIICRAAGLLARAQMMAPVGILRRTIEVTEGIEGTWAAAVRERLRDLCAPEIKNAEFAIQARGTFQEQEVVRKYLERWVIPGLRNGAYAAWREAVC